VRRAWIITSLIAAILVILSVSYLVTFDLFLTPKAVTLSRQRFSEMKEAYFQGEENPFLARLGDRMELQSNHFKDIVIYPLDGEHLLLSKHEKGPLLLSIVISLEVELVEGKPVLVSLKRGSREVPVDLAWVYFGEELEILRGCSTATPIQH